MTKTPFIAALVTIFLATNALGQFIAPVLPSTDLDGPALGYSTDINTYQSGLYDTFTEMLANPGADEDGDGVTDLQEFLTGADRDSSDDGQTRMQDFNLALALATDWTTQNGYGDSSTVDLIERLTDVTGETSLPSYLPLEGLSPTLETQFHEELAELAKTLDYDPSKIYEWVYTNVEFEDYALSRKGSLATYRTRRGNEWDQCSLLITLYRMSGIPARYAVGRTYESVEGIADTKKELVLVQAWLPASPYPQQSDTELDSPNRAWITLAPWHKDLHITGGIDIAPLGEGDDVLIPSELKITNNNLIARWDFNNNSNDTQGINNGTAVNAGYAEDTTRPAAPSDPTNNPNGLNVLHLPSVSSTRFLIRNHSRLNDSSFTKRTISLWFKDEAYDNTGKEEMLFTQGIVTSGISIYLKNSDLYIGTYNTDLDQDGSADGSTVAQYGKWIVKENYAGLENCDGLWHHVVLVIDAESPYVSSNTNMRAYLDGTLLGSKACSVIHPDRNMTNGNIENQYLSPRTVIGGASSFVRVSGDVSGNSAAQSASSGAASNFIGYIDDVRVYDSALTEADINRLGLNEDLDDTRNYLQPVYDDSDADPFDAHTQLSAIEFLEAKISDYLASCHPTNTSIKDVPREVTVENVPNGHTPTTFLSSLVDRSSVSDSDPDLYINDVTEASDPLVLGDEMRAISDLNLRKSSGTYLQAEYDLGLEGRWRMDEEFGDYVNGSGIKDPTNGRWNGVIDNTEDVPNSPEWAPDEGVVGGALRLNNSGDHVKLDNSNFINDGFNTRTVMMWVKADSTYGNQVLYDEGGTDAGLAIRINNGNIEAVVATQILDISGIWTKRTTVSAAYTSTNWVHVAVVFGDPDGSGNDSDLLRIRLDGDSVASVHHTHNTLPIDVIGVDGTTDTMSGLGGRLNGTAFATTTGSGNWFSGLIDDVRVYNKALNGVQVKDAKDTTLAEANLIKTRVMLPQVAGRRLVVDFNTGTYTDLESTEHNTASPRLKLDGQILNSGTGAFLEAAEKTYDETVTFSDSFTVGYRFGTVPYTERPSIRPNALVNIALDPLAASRERIYEVAEELDELATRLSFNNSPDTYELYLGRVSDLLTEAYNERFERNARRLDSLLWTNRVHHSPYQLTVNNTFPDAGFNEHRMAVLIWTYPDEEDSVPTGQYNSASFGHVSPAWRIDALFASSYVYKSNAASPEIFKGSDELALFQSTVVGTAASYNESAIFEDWQGTPALGTIEGLFAAISDGIDIVTIGSGTSLADIQSIIPGETDSALAIEAKIYNDVTATATSVDKLSHSNVIAARDTATGVGYIMYSAESVHERFNSSPPNANNNDHFIAVVFDSGQWKYDNDTALVAFDPITSDVLVAKVDFSLDRIQELKDYYDTIDGIQAGYADGNLLLDASTSGDFVITTGVDTISLTFHGYDGVNTTTPTDLVVYKDPEGNPYVESDLRITQSEQGSTNWLFGQFNGGRSWYDYDTVTRLNTSSSTTLNTNLGTPDLSSDFQKKNYTASTVTEDNASGTTTTHIQNISSETSNTTNRDVIIVSGGDPVDLFNGEFYLEEPADLMIRSRGMPLEVTRRYGSTILYNGPFGFGWGWSHADTLTFLTDSENNQLTHVIYSDASRKVYRFEDQGSGVYEAPPGSTFELKPDTTYTNGYAIHHNDGRVYRFNADGQLKEKSDALDHTLTFTYDTDLNITRITDPLGRSLTLTYNDDDHVIRVTDYNGRSTQYGYDGDDLIWFKDLEGNVYRYEYLKNQDNVLNNHNMSKQILPTGDYLEIYYFKDDTVSHHINSNNDAFYFQYSWLNRYAETWNEAGFYRKIFWNKNGDMIRANTRDGAIEYREYDEQHNLIAQTDGNGNRTVFQYDDKRNLISFTTPEGDTQATIYNDENRPEYQYTQVDEIEHDGGDDYHIDVLETYLEYNSSDPGIDILVDKRHIGIYVKELIVDADGVPVLNGNGELQFTGNFSASLDSEKHTTEYDYDKYGNLIMLTEKIRQYDGSGSDLDNAVTEYFYDIHGLNNVRTKDPLGRFTNYTYDDFGRVIATTDPDGNTTQVELNAYGQPTRLVDAAGGVTINEYDENRRLVKTKNPLEAVSSITYTTPFYGRNFERIATQTDPLGHVTSYEYDAVGDRIATTDANGNTTTFKYDELNRLIQTTNALGDKVRNRYDGAGNLTETTAIADGEERTTRFTYDKANGLIRRWETWGDQRATEFEYDERGNLTLETIGYYGENNTSESPVFVESLSTEYVYNRLNRKIKTISNSDDPNSHNIRTIEYEHDSLGRLREERIKGATVVNQTTGTPSASDYLSRTTYTYDEAGNLTDEMMFAWDPDAGPAAWETVPESHVHYDYDDRNLRIKTTLKDTKLASYATDPTSAASDFRTTEVTYDALGRIKTSSITVNHVDGVSSAVHKTVKDYDAAGNLVRTRYLIDGFENSYTRKTEFAYNKRNELIASTNALGHTRTFTYDGNGNQISATDEEGFTTYASYDALSRQVSTRDALGYTTTYEYDGFGNQIASVSPLGERTTLEYNENNQVVEQYTPLHNEGLLTVPVELQYDGYGRLTQTVDARSNEQNYTTYNDFGEPYKVTQYVKLLDDQNQSEPEIITAYDGLGRALSIKDPKGIITRMTYDVLGRTLTVTQAESTSEEVTTQYEYDPVGNVIQEVRALNTSDEFTTTYEYDELNRLIKTIVGDPSGTNLTSTTAYDDDTNTVTSEDPYGVTATTYADAAGQRIKTELGGIETASWKYDRRGLIIKSDTPNDAPTVFEYDARGQLTRLIEAPGSVIEAITRFEYDANGRQTRVTDANGNITQKDYDANGRVVRTIEALGETEESITKFRYDPNGNLLAVIDGNHISEAGEYRVAIDTDEDDEEAVRYTYDELNRVTYTYDYGPSDLSNREVQTVRYDLNGNAEITTLRDGTEITRTYDNLNRVEAVEDTTGIAVPLQEFEYDKLSRITTASDTNAGLSTPVTYNVDLDYDFAGRTFEEVSYVGTTRAHAVKTTYSAGTSPDSRIITKDLYADYTPQTPTISRTITYKENMRGLLSKVESMGVTDTRYTYNNSGRLTSQVLGSDTLGHTLQLTYDSRGRESERRYDRNANPTTNSFRQVTTYDAIGNIKTEAITDYIGGSTPITDYYDYDELHRLTRKGPSGTPNASNDTEWDHDKVGNWSNTDQNGSVENYVVSGNNEYTAIGAGAPSTNRHYDDRGNLIYIGANQSSPANDDLLYTYDWANRLVKAEQYDAAGAGTWRLQAEYAYDALNRRVAMRKGSSGSLHFYVYDGSRVVMDLYDPDGTGLPTLIIHAKSYAYNSYVDSPAFLINEEHVYDEKLYYFQDRRYSVVALASWTGDVTERSRYQPFGGMTAFINYGGSWTTRTSLSQPNISIVGNPYGFTGRRYDPETDPTGNTAVVSEGLWHYRNRMYSSTLGRFLQRDPAGYVDGYNLYAYVMNNPLMYVDPSGFGGKLIGAGLANAILNDPARESPEYWKKQDEYARPSEALFKNFGHDWDSKDYKDYTVTRETVLRGVVAGFLMQTSPSLAQEPYAHEFGYQTLDIYTSKSYMSNVYVASPRIADSIVLVGELPSNLYDIHNEFFQDPLSSIPVLSDTYFDLGISYYAGAGNAIENTGRGAWNLLATIANNSSSQAQMNAMMGYGLPTVENRYWAGDYGITDKYFSASLQVDAFQLATETMGGEAIGAWVFRGSGLVDDGLRLTDDMMTVDNVVTRIDGQWTKVDNALDTSGSIGVRPAKTTRVYPDGSIRTPDGKFASVRGAAPPGTPGEKLVVQGLRDQGVNVVGEQVTVRGLVSTRRYDAVVLDSKGRLWGIEVKSGTASKTPLQRLNDIHVQHTRDAVILGDGPLAGQKIFGVQTIYVK